MSWADRIAYVCHDFEDAVAAGIVTEDMLPPLVADRVGRDRSRQLGTFVRAMIEATASTGRIGMIDPIAEALKKENDKKPKPKQEAKAQPPQKHEPKRERVFDQSKIAALLDKRDPTRHAIAGDAINAQAALGTARGHSADNSATWGAMFKQQVERCWKKPYGGIEAQRIETSFTIKLKRDGSLESMPVPLPGTNTPYFRVYQESAMRAIIPTQSPCLRPPCPVWKEKLPRP